MAKRRRMTQQPQSASDLPGVHADVEDDQHVEHEAVIETEPKPVEVISVVITERSCTVPVASGLEGYARCNVLTRFNGREAGTLKGLLQGLERKGVRLEDGSAIKTQSHVLRYLVQQLAVKK